MAMHNFDIKRNVSKKPREKLKRNLNNVAAEVATIRRTARGLEKVLDIGGNKVFRQLHPRWKSFFNTGDPNCELKCMMNCVQGLPAIPVHCTAHQYRSLIGHRNLWKKLHTP